MCFHGMVEDIDYSQFYLLHQMVIFLYKAVTHIYFQNKAMSNRH